MTGPNRTMNMTRNIPFIIPATKGEGDHFVHHKGEEEETKQEHPVAMDILVVQIYTTTSTYRKPLIVLFVPKEIHDYDSPRLFRKSTNHTNSYNEWNQKRIRGKKSHPTNPPHHKTNHQTEERIRKMMKKRIS
jgi:hypothetical protein